ncbi:hypothetical protein BJ085DRAFT_41003, partial [Dimargaris cristalligena]
MGGFSVGHTKRPKLRICRRRTPVVPLALDSWKVSFGKFLELFFYQTSLYCRADLCPHSINYHHTVNFGYRGLVTRFFYTPIVLSEVSIPPLKLYVDSRVNIEIKRADAEQLRTQIVRFWDSLAERLKGFDIWDLVLTERIEACRVELNEMLKMAEAERVYMLQFVNQVNENTHPADTLALNAVRTVVQEKIYDWDSRFDQFARDYILPERDFRKHAGRKIRHMLLGPPPESGTKTGVPSVVGSPTQQTSPRLTSRVPTEVTAGAGEPSEVPSLGKKLEDLVLANNHLTTPAADSTNPVPPSNQQDLPLFPELGESDSEVSIPDLDTFLQGLNHPHCVEDTQWLPYPVNMNPTVYRRLSIEHMRAEAAEGRVPSPELSSEEINPTPESLYPDSEGPEASAMWDRDTDASLFPLPALTGETGGVSVVSTAPFVHVPLGPRVRKYGGPTPGQTTDDDLASVSSSPAKGTATPEFLSALASRSVNPRRSVETWSMPTNQARDRSTGPVPRKPTGPSRRDLPVLKANGVPIAGLPPLPPSIGGGPGIGPRPPGMRMGRPLPSPSLIPQPSTSYLAPNRRLSALGPPDPHQISLAPTRDAVPPPGGRGRGRQSSSPHPPSDARWRANVSRVAHRIQATLGRSGDGKQRLNRIFQINSTKLMRRSTAPVRPRLELYSTTNDAVKAGNDEENGLDRRASGSDRLNRRGRLTPTPADPTVASSLLPPSRRLLSHAKPPERAKPRNIRGPARVSSSTYGGAAPPYAQSQNRNSSAYGPSRSVTNHSQHHPATSSTTLDHPDENETGTSTRIPPVRHRPRSPVPVRSRPGPGRPLAGSSSNQSGAPGPVGPTSVFGGPARGKGRGHSTITTTMGATPPPPRRLRDSDVLPTEPAYPGEFDGDHYSDSRNVSGSSSSSDLSFVDDDGDDDEEEDDDDVDSEGEQMLAALLGADFLRLTRTPSPPPGEEFDPFGDTAKSPRDEIGQPKRPRRRHHTSHRPNRRPPPEIPLDYDLGILGPAEWTTDDNANDSTFFDPSPTVATPHESVVSVTPSEQTSVLKAISNYLVPALTHLLLPLDYPLPPTAHVLPDSAVVIYEDQLSTIIAYTLSSRDFRHQFSAIAQQAALPAAAAAVAATESPAVDSPNLIHLETSLKSPQSNHARYEFSHGPAKFTCKIFFAEQFDALRRSCDCDSAFIESLSRCSPWNASGGKSGSAFLKTQDNRFILKQISKPEMDAFLKFAPNYFHYLAEAIFHELPTLLAKIYGIYTISLKNAVTGRSVKLDVMIMENLFYERTISRT